MGKKLYKVLKTRHRMLDLLINLTPTGAHRNHLTNENINIIHLMNKYKKKLRSNQKNKRWQER